MEATGKKGEEEEQEEDDDQEPAPLISQQALKDRLWTIVTEGKFKDLKKFFHIFRKNDVPLDDFNDDFDEDGGNVLMQCVKEGCDRGNSFGRDYIKCIRLLIEKGTSTDDQDKAGRTPLHWAVFSKNVNFVNELIESGADPTIRDQDGMDPFHLSIIIGAKEIFNSIVRDREVEFLDHKDGKGVPPVVAAIQHRQLDFARRLLDLGVDINATDRRLKRTALHYAISLKRLDLYELLLKYKPEVDVADYQGKTVFHRVCGNKDPRYFQKLIETYNGIPEDVMDQAADDGMTPVIIACQNGNPEQLKELLDKGASASDADKTGKSALHYCADNLETQCAEMILHKDGDLLNSKDEQGFTPLHMAVIGGNAPLLRLLLKKDADINCLDNEHHTVAHWATVCGHLEVLEILLENGADVSRADSHEAFPIHYAAQMNGKENGHTDPKIGEKVLKKLVDNGVPTDVLDKDGRQPLLWAASAGNSESCKLLVKAGADVNAIDKDGLSALHCAASRGHVKCIETLKNLGANVDLADKNNCTALFYAITLGNKECTKALLKFGSNPNHQDNRGRTPTHCAAIKGCVDTVKMLDKHTAQLWTPSIREDCPIHEAAQGGFCDVVKYLLKWKNDPSAVNIPNKGGRTCLHISAIVNNLPLCKLLIDNGADKNAAMIHKDKTYTPYDAAVVKGNQETAEYIKGKGGNSASNLDKTGKRESKSAKSRRSVLTLESTPEEREKEEQAEYDKKGDVILTPVSSPSKGKKGGKGDKDKDREQDKEAEKKHKEAEKKGKDEQKSDGEEDEDEEDAKDPGVKPLVAAGVGLKAKDKKNKDKEADTKKKTKGKSEEEKDSEKQRKESRSEEEEEEKDTIDKTVPLGKAGVGAKRKGKGEKEEETEAEVEEEEAEDDNIDEAGKKSRKSSEQDDEAARVAAAAAAATAVKVKRRGSKEAGKKDSRGDSGVEADSEQESSEEDGQKEKGKEKSEQPKGKTGQTAGGRVHRKKRKADTVEEEEEEEEEKEEGESAGKQDTAALAAAALLAEEEKKKKSKQEKGKEDQNEEKKQRDLEEQKKKKESEKLKEEERKKKEADKFKEDERKKREAAEKLKEEEKKKKAEQIKEAEKKKKAEQLKEEERKKKEAAEKLKEEEKKKKEAANRKGLRVATPKQGGKTGIEAQDHSHAPAAGAAGIGLKAALSAGKDNKEKAEVQKEEVGIQTDRKEEKEKPKTTDTGIQTKKNHTRQSGSQTELSGDQVVSRESSLDRQPKSRVRTASKDGESEGEFEVPKGSPESEAEALRVAAAKRSVSRAESESNREEKPQSRQRVIQSPAKVPTDGRISQGLLTNSRKPSRQRTFERSDSPELSSGEDIDEKDYVDAQPRSRKQRAQNKLQNRTRRLRNRQVAGVYHPDRLSKPISVHKQIKDKKKLARERDSQLNGGLVEMDRSDEISDLEHSILRTRRGGGRCVNSIQESVRRYQSERRMVRQLHQLKRAQIYTGPMHDVVLFSKLMDVYRNNAPHDGDSTLDSQVLEDWEGYLRDNFEDKEDQLQFVSHFYEDDRTGLRSGTNTVRTRPSRSEKSANSAKRSVDNRYAELRFKEEFDMTEREAEREALDDRMKDAAKKTDESLKSVHSKTSNSLNEAKKVNDQLQNDFRRDVTDRLKSGNSTKRERQWLIQESLSDEAQSQAESAEKARREKYKEWHKKKNEELRRKLLNVYGPDQDYSDLKNSKAHSFKSSTPRIAYTSTPRPKSQITMTSGGMSQAQYGMDREITVQMTEYGMRRVKKEPDNPFGNKVKSKKGLVRKGVLEQDHSEANWTPKFDGSLRPRAGLVFVEPDIYDEALKDEQRMKKAYSIAARSSANVTMDDERLLGPVSS
ncbi:trichohyalin-like isoform X4 [Mizuhopecten yessoensis]|uniref:trichohyalin-like isoform X4 n=1 Tax=Mizuhopecten yessoensis TaxID=6573 RepID=UPI000B459DD6|nr:trichohyalin-like isoform X4 [Mizuhopecten yessoensis]